MERVMGTSSAQRVQKHREGLRAAGMRPVQIWVPDTRREDFALECRRQSLLLKDDPHEVDTQNWVHAVADTEGWQ
ncbi:MAG: antitoxin MazE family protein [Rhodoferax sp.]